MRLDYKRLLKSVSGRVAHSFAQFANEWGTEKLASRLRSFFPHESLFSFPLNRILSSSTASPQQSSSGIFNSSHLSRTILIPMSTAATDFKDTLKQQADIVRIIGDYVKL